MTSLSTEQRQESTTELLRATQIWKDYGNGAILKGIDFDVLPGEVHALVGENGAGKSTLIKILSGREKPTSGRLVYFGREQDHLDAAAAQQMGVAVVPQHVELAPDLTVADNVYLNSWPASSGFVRRHELERNAAHILETLAIDLDVRAVVRDLSYMQRQMLGIARVLRFEPRLVFLDEPTAALSAKEVRPLFQLIESLKVRGIGFIYVSHFLNELGLVADRVTVLRDGEVVDQGRQSSFTTDRLVRSMVGEIGSLYPARQEHLCTEPEWVVGVASSNGPTFTAEVCRGEIVGIAAPKGEGISEALRTVAGIPFPGVTPTVSRAGEGVDVGSPRSAHLGGIGYVSEERSRWGVIPGLNLAQNLTLGDLSRIVSRAGILSARRELSIAGELARSFAVRTPGLQASMGHLSGGNQQKALLARVLGSSTGLCVLDDPTNGVDVGSKAEINRSIDRATSQGCAVLMHSSDLFQLLGMCDRVMLIKSGRHVDTFRRGAISEQQLEALIESDSEGGK